MIPINTTGQDERVFSCDTLVARAPSGPPRTIFGKNSDRPYTEAQPLEAVPRATHPPGSYVRCQYLTDPSVEPNVGGPGEPPLVALGFRARRQRSWCRDRQ